MDFLDSNAHRLAGYRAWEAGVIAEDNPHEWFTDKWRLWHDGWMQAFHDAKAEAEAQRAG